MFNNINLTTKITVALSSIIVGMVIVAVVSYNGIYSLGNNIKEISEYKEPLVNTVIEIEKDILKQEVLTKELVIASTDVKSQRFQQLEDDVIKMEHNNEVRLTRCKKLATKAAKHATTQELATAYLHIDKVCNNLHSEQNEFETKFKELIQSVKNNSIHIEATQEKELGNKLANMDHQVVSVVHSMEKLSDKLAKHSQKNESTILMIVTIVAVFILLLAIIIAVLLNKEVKSKINNFQNGLLEFFKYLNREITTVSKLDDSSQDEMGHMAKVVNENIAKIQTSIEEERKLIDESIYAMSEFEQGDMCQRINGNSNNPALNELKDVINKMGNTMETNIDNVLDILEQYSNYNYLNKVNEKGLKEHLLKLANGVNRLGDAITNMLIENKQNGLTLDDTSDILLENVDTLNVNSNAAAASLEETAAALEEITSNIASNTTNIIKMSDFASQLTVSANEGADLANETTTAMTEIDEQVNAINEAITVIDQIAFQTNILSLNAAVEAATAGEAGKGFAVVAQEVRNLASRSAEAANEIKSLVENATNKANNGKIISDKMIEGYNGLNENISKTIELISSVELASKEQLQGIEQINHAVTTLDEQTQQNATVANKTKELAIQTQQIAQTVINSANEKEFEGKNDIQPTKTNTTQDNQLNNITSTNNKSSVKTNHNINNTPTTPKEHIQVKSTPTPAIQPKEILPTIEPISSNNQDDDEWETF